MANPLDQVADEAVGSSSLEVRFINLPDYLLYLVYSEQRGLDHGRLCGSLYSAVKHLLSILTEPYLNYYGSNFSAAHTSMLNQVFQG